MRPSLSPQAYASSLLASVLAGSLFIWPLHVVLAAGQNADLVLVLAGGTMAIWTVIVPGVGREPTPAAAVLDGMALVLMMAVDGPILVSLGSMLQTFYFPETPRWALVGIFLAVVVGWTLRRPHSAPILAGLWVPLLLTGSLGMVGLACTNLRFIRVLAPLPTIGLRPLGLGLVVMAFVVLPLPITLRRYGSLRQETPRWRDRLIPAIVAWAFLGLLYAVVVGTLGPTALTQLRWPLVFTLDQVTLDSAFFLSRIGVLVIFAWTLGAAVGVLVHFDVMVSSPRGNGVPLWAVPAIGAVWFAAILLIPSPAWATWWLVHRVNFASAGYLTLDALYSSIRLAQSRRLRSRLDIS